MIKLFCEYIRMADLEEEYVTIEAAKARGEFLIRSDMYEDDPEIMQVWIEAPGRTLHAYLDGDGNIDWEG